MNTARAPAVNRGRSFLCTAFEKYIMVFAGQFRLEPIPQLVKGTDIRPACDVVLRQPAHHLAPGHFAHGALFDDLAVLMLTEGAGEEADGLGQMWFHRAAVFLGGQVEHKIRFRSKLAGQSIAPEFVQIAAVTHRQLCLHLQPVGGHAVEGPQQAVESGQNEQMLAEIVQLGRLHHPRGHVLVLDAFIGDDGGGEAPAQIHGGQPLCVQLGNGVVAFPEGLQF